jgi:hypothetical protein
MNIYTTAIHYASKGWSVLPVHSFIDGCCTCGNKLCRSPAKHPLTPNGFKDASTDPGIIRRWLDDTEGKANLGIATGNGLLVVDVDPKSGGMASLEDWEERFGKLPMTPTVRTGSGGKHFYFQYPRQLSLGNRVAVVPGIDTRANDGYAVAPPSLHANGERYVWEIADDMPLAVVPSWLLDILTHAAGPPDGTALAASASMVLRVQPAADLADAPGVPEGRRHSWLCQLVGAHLARGEKAGAVVARALEWAARCEPPLDEAEVHRTVSSLAKKHATAQAVSGGEEDLDALPLPQAAPWPVLDEAALYGLTGDAVHLLAPQTEADPVAILVSILVCVGNYLGRKIGFRVEGDRHYPNLFACLVGESSRSRKGTSLGRTLALWHPDDAWRSKCIANGLSSGEGLKHAVRDKLEANEPIREKGRIVSYQAVIKDQGVKDKRLLVVESEFAQALRVAQREGNTLSPVVRQAWDTGTLRTLTRNDPTVATDAHISILGHITRQELAQDLSVTDCMNGFANRFNWVLVKRSKFLPDGGEEVDLTPLQARLRQILEHTSGDMARSPAARDLWHQLYPVLTADRPGLWGKVTSRGEAQTLRLSMVYAALDGRTVIDVPHLQAAFAVWQYAEASARLIFSEQETLPPLERLLLAKIEAAPGINRKQLHKALGGHVTAQAMVQALGKLADRQMIRTKQVATGGRPSECWWLGADFPAMPSDLCSAAGAPPGAAAGARTQPATETRQAERVAAPKEDGTDRGRVAGDSSFARTVEVAPPSPRAEDSSFARGESALGAANAGGRAGAKEPCRLSLAGLLDSVKSIDGRLRREGDVVVVDAPAERLTPAMTQALAAYQEDLLTLFPASAPARAEVVIEEIGESTFLDDLARKYTERP